MSLVLSSDAHRKYYPLLVLSVSRAYGFILSYWSLTLYFGAYVCVCVCVCVGLFMSE